MGKNKSKKSFKWKKKHPDHDDRCKDSYQNIVRENKLFESCYKGQEMLPEHEWEEFMTALRRELPSTFRITGNKSHAQELLRIIKSEFVNQEEDEANIREKPVAPLHWYPDELAWETKTARREIRKSEKMKQFHKFLVQETNCGAITRQEAVSMIPPLFMDIKPYHKVLDMCAAPGSKTAQLIEMMNEDSDKELPTGVIVANDSNNRRCYMLVHQSKRLQSPCCMITNHDASVYPFLTTVNSSNGCPEPFLFDRILCDVPCSGDGTMRKNPQIWPRWSPHLGVSLHRLQLKILVRGLELLSEGGRIVYSTCTVNPLEDEAVIATAISMSKGAVELLDVSGELPNLKRSPGLTKWKVFSKAGEELKSIDDIENETYINEGYKKSMFPPTTEENEKINLQRCIRVYPHQQDTGGFFIAVLKKNGPLPWQSKNKAQRMAHKKLLPWEFLQKQAEKTENENGKESDMGDNASKEGDSVDAVSAESNLDDNQKVAEPPKKKVKRKGFIEDPFLFLKEDDPLLNEIINFFGFPQSFPKSQALTRTEAGIRRHVYFVSEKCKEIIDYNYNNLKIINCGLKVFTRCTLKTGETQGCNFRLTQEGIQSTFRYVDKQKIEISYEDLKLLLTEGEPKTEKLCESTRKQLDQNYFGCVLWHLDPSTNQSERFELSNDVWLCGHRGKSTVRCMMAKTERLHLLRILGLPVDDTELKTSKMPEDEETMEEDEIRDGADEEGNEEDVIENEEA
ncbi:RNA cytosine-C(5)-methyltransferase NSUN2-like isoform X2 [Rhopilema esculentum]|uniref:RNA cytosine-C(5)-methyltransferase NSUN2-like isoform X2 n=1 Tax=Rhopilema esculentum TaxID=499914 RepID=UPI0031D71364